MIADDNAPELTVRSTDGALREVTFLFPDEPLVCTAGHAIDQDFWILGDTMYVMGGARCDFVASPEERQGRPLGAKEVRQYRCGRTVLFVKTPTVTIVSTVPPRELHAMAKERMPLSRIREFLGLDWRGRLAAAGRKR